MTTADALVVAAVIAAAGAVQLAAGFGFALAAVPLLSIVLDPHSAVAVAVAEKESRDPALPMIVLGTAHPAKFPDAVAAACGVTP